MTALVALQTCKGCGGRVALGLMRCGRCQTVTAQFAQQMKEKTMPRITVANGPTNPAAGPGEVGYMLHGEHGPELVYLPAGAVVMPLEQAASAPRDYAGMTLAELRDAAKERGLPTYGSKSALLERLGPGDAGDPAADSDAEEVQA